MYQIMFQEEGPSDMPVTHDSMRLIEQVKTVCEHRIYLDEAKELYSLISSKWLHVSQKYVLYQIYIYIPCNMCYTALRFYSFYRHLFDYT